MDSEVLFKTAVDILSKIRSDKTTQQKSLNFPVQEAVIQCSSTDQLLIKDIQEDLIRAGTIETLTFVIEECDSPTVSTQF